MDYLKGDLCTRTKLGVPIGIILAPMTSVGGAADLSGQRPEATNSAAALPQLSPAKPTIWQDGVGNGFVASAQNVAVEAGASHGIIIFGSKQAYDLGLLSVSYGHMLGRVQTIGAMAATLGGVDGLVFTAGVGENSAQVRALVCENLGHLGLKLDSTANVRCKPDADISGRASPGRILSLQPGRI